MLNNISVFNIQKIKIFIAFIFIIFLITPNKLKSVCNADVDMNNNNLNNAKGISTKYIVIANCLHFSSFKDLPNNELILKGTSGNTRIYASGAKICTASGIFRYGTYYLYDATPALAQTLSTGACINLLSYNYGRSSHFFTINHMKYGPINGVYATFRIDQRTVDDIETNIAGGSMVICSRYGFVNI